MIIVKLMGGLGNQMFQYAFGRQLAERHHAELKLDTHFLLDRTPRKGHQVFRNYDLDIFNIREPLAGEEEIFRFSQRSHNRLLDKALTKLLGPKKSMVAEPHFHFSQAAFNAPDDVYLSGYWQSEKYFAPAREQVRAAFSFRNPVSIAAEALLADIRKQNSVCINVRRGDFVTNPFHGSYGTDYFQRAIAIIEERIADPAYFIFSDDVDWCQEHLQFIQPSTIVSHQYAGEKYQDYLRLMAACQHFIIPNSSFAWWAVWLNEDPRKTVIAPTKWFNDERYNTNDLLPADWIRI